MEQVQYEGLMGIASEINKKSDAILANFKTKENQVINQEVIPQVSKEEMETIVKEKVAVIGDECQANGQLQGIEDSVVSADGIYFAFATNTGRS